MNITLPEAEPLAPPAEPDFVSDDWDVESLGVRAAHGGDLDDFDEEDFDDEFDDDFEEELEDEYELSEFEDVTEDDLIEDDDALTTLGGDFVDEDAEPDEAPGEAGNKAKDDEEAEEEE